LRFKAKAELAIKQKTIEIIYECYCKDAGAMLTIFCLYWALSRTS